MILGAGEGRRIALGDQRLRVLSEGTLVHDVAIVDTVLPPGSGAPRHVHHDHEESFYVVEGRVRIELDDTVVEAGPGAIVVATRGRVHGFTNVGDTDARLLAVYAPASALGYLDDLAAVLASGDDGPAAMAAFYERWASGSA